MDKIKSTLKNFIENKYSRNEFFGITSGFEKNEEDGTFVNELKDQWDKLDDNKAPGFSTQKVWSTILARTKPEHKRTGKTIWMSVQRAAAILFLPLLLTSLYFFYTFTSDQGKTAFAEIHCPMGVRTQFELPDGTTGSLNSGSSLKYPVEFARSRDISLAGEAFFDVVHDKRHPFTVKTEHLNVKVLGTKFNVLAYKNGQTERVILEQGKVEISSKTGKSITILNPDHQLILDTEKMNYRKEEVDAGIYIAWIEGKLMFRDENIQQVVERLSLWYNVDIELMDKELLKYTFRATFVDEPVEEVLKLMALSAPLKFEEVSRKSKNEEYQKRKIILRLDRNK